MTACTAYRVSRATAQAAFLDGATVIVSDRSDRGPLFEVHPDTTTNPAPADPAARPQAWRDLAAAMDAWRRPQSIYVLPPEPRTRG